MFSSSVYDATMRSNVIKLDGQAGNGYVVGDRHNESRNPNDTAWNSTKPVVSFWYKGGASVYIYGSSGFCVGRLG